MTNSHAETQPVISYFHLQKLLREFKEQRGKSFQLTALGYFGSYARGETSPDSDMDIVFKTDYPNLLLTSRLRLDLMELLNGPVDVIRYRESMNPHFKARLDKEAIYVGGRPAARLTHTDPRSPQTDSKTFGEYYLLIETVRQMLQDLGKQS